MAETLPEPEPLFPRPSPGLAGIAGLAQDIDLVGLALTIQLHGLHNTRSYMSKVHRILFNNCCVFSWKMTLAASSSSRTSGIAVRRNSVRSQPSSRSWEEQADRGKS